MPHQGNMYVLLIDGSYVSSKISLFFSDFDPRLFIERVGTECPCRQQLVVDISEAILNGETKILLIGPSGAGKSRIAKSIIKSIAMDYTIVTESDGYDVYERESLSQLKKKFESKVILIEELTYFCMKATPRDLRLTASLSYLLSQLKFVIATTRSVLDLDPSITRYFKSKFVLTPPDINGQLALFKSLPSTFDCPLLEQLNSIPTLEEQKSFLKQFGGLQPSELLTSEKYEPKNALNAIAGVTDILKKLEFLILKPLVEPEIFDEVGVSPPRGVLLYGPSGCGKTSIARSIGKASRVSFFDVSGVEIIAKEVGESEKRLHTIFERARASAPAIILFDDIDALAPRRDFGASLSEASDRLLTTLLVETDGLSGRDDGVIIVATTSRLQSLDPALTRPGRFDYLIEIGLPNAASRGEIFDLYTKSTLLENSEEARTLVVSNTEKRTGADIEGIIREAAMITLRTNIDSFNIPVSSFKEALAQYNKNKQVTKTSVLTKKKPIQPKKNSKYRL